MSAPLRSALRETRGKIGSDSVPSLCESLLPMSLYLETARVAGHNGAVATPIKKRRERGRFASVLQTCHYLSAFPARVIMPRGVLRLFISRLLKSFNSNKFAQVLHLSIFFFFFLQSVTSRPRKKSDTIFNFFRISRYVRIAFYKYMGLRSGKSDTS